MWKKEPVRAMSVSLSNLSDGENIQLSLFDSKDKEQKEALKEFSKLCGEDPEKP